MAIGPKLNLTGSRFRAVGGKNIACGFGRCTIDNSRFHEAQLLSGLSDGPVWKANPTGVGISKLPNSFAAPSSDAPKEHSQPHSFGSCLLAAAVLGTLEFRV